MLQTYTSVERLFGEEQAELLKNIPPWTIKKPGLRWRTCSLKVGGAKIIDIGCRDGSMVYTMAVLAPNMNFIG